MYNLKRIVEELKRVSDIKVEETSKNISIYAKEDNTLLYNITEEDYLEHISYHKDRPIIMKMLRENVVTPFRGEELAKRIAEICDTSYGEYEEYVDTLWEVSDSHGRGMIYLSDDTIDTDTSWFKMLPYEKQMKIYDAIIEHINECRH